MRVRGPRDVVRAERAFIYFQRVASRKVRVNIHRERRAIILVIRHFVGVLDAIYIIQSVTGVFDL